MPTMISRETQAARRNLRREIRESARHDVRVLIRTTRERSDGGYQLAGESRVYLRSCIVERDGDVLAYDTVGQTYSRHHDLAADEVAEAQRQAAEIRAARSKAVA